MQLRIGFAELMLVASVGLLAGLCVLFVVEWPVALIPAGTYGIASVASYAGYRQYARERQQAKANETIAQFRVVDTRGVCPAGRQPGDVITLMAGATTPFVCEAAGTVLRMAAADGMNGQQWCCPVYEHLLVFEREKVAA